MGRVDEAMRRAAESGAERSSEAKGTTDVTGSDPASIDLPIDAFPTEAPERPRLRSVSPQATAPVAPAAKVAPKLPAILPSLGERLGANLSRKVVIDREMDPASKEQYRRLATSLYAAQAASGLKVVMVASALASEGKSLTASNLALTFSESYQKSVLLIDADLRRPSLHTVFGLPGSPGLTDGLLVSDTKLTLHHVTEHLTVLVAGDPTSDPMGILASERMQRLIGEARETFDWVLIDTPPIGLLSDASLMAQAADGALLVVRAESTPHDVVQRAVTMLGKDRVLGIVLNRAKPTEGAGYKYHSYYQAAPASNSVRG